MMSNNKKHSKGTSLKKVNQLTLKGVDFNQNNGMTRVYSAFEKDSKKSNEYFDKLIHQL